MDEIRHPSPASGRPLLPLHTMQRPPFSQSPSSDYQLPELLKGNGHEADISDSGAQSDEKAEPRSPTRQNQPDVKVASSGEEGRALGGMTVQNEVLEPRRTIEKRLETTLDVAKQEQAKYAQRAKLAAMAVNSAMFMQIAINSLITGLSASTNNRNAQLGVSALGAIGTIIASFLVRVRGTREPERSVTHSQNLEKYIRELEAFILDEGLVRDRKWDAEVTRFRVEFDKLQTAVHQSENGQPMSEKK